MARGSVSTTKVLIPRLQKVVTPILNDLFDLTQLVCSKTLGICVFNRIEPELCHLPFAAHVHVRWLAPFVTVEEESVRTDGRKVRHRVDSRTLAVRRRDSVPDRRYRTQTDRTEPK
jgi:hypothetical protein